MISRNAEDILYNLWKMYGSYFENNSKSQIQYDKNNLVEEFFFIVLGGFGISYELNLSALNVLRNKELLNSNLFSKKEYLASTIELLKNEFNTRQFEPLTKSKELRKYRFINNKSIIVAKAGYWLWNECKWDINKKLEQVTEMPREWLCTCPGIGLKSASWFLRNIGYSNNYAVLDVHILRFASKIGIEVPKTLSEEAYLRIENILRELCKKIGLTLGKVDFLLWCLGRYGYLDYVRCE